MSADALGLSDVDTLDQISTAFVVLLQRLTTSERPVLLLHDVFDFDRSGTALPPK